MDAEYVEFTFTGTSSILEITLDTPFTIPANKKAEVALKNVSFYNSIPNIDTGNNTINIRIPEEEYRQYTLSTGAYEVENLNEALLDKLCYNYPMRKREIRENFKLSPDEATGKAVFKFGKNGFGVKFDENGSLANLLGFLPNTEITLRGNHTGANLVQITKVSTLFFKFNLSEANFVNSERSQTIYTAVLDSSPGFRWSRELSTLTYKRLIKDSFSYLRVWITMGLVLKRYNCIRKRMDQSTPLIKYLVSKQNFELDSKNKCMKGNERSEDCQCDIIVGSEIIPTFQCHYEQWQKWREQLNLLSQ